LLNRNLGAAQGGHCQLSGKLAQAFGPFVNTYPQSWKMRGETFEKNG
jgi:hypothetical protein